MDSAEIAQGIIVDYDTDNNIIGIELLGIKTINHGDFTLLNSLFPPDELVKFQ